METSLVSVVEIALNRIVKATALDEAQDMAMAALILISRLGNGGPNRKKEILNDGDGSTDQLSK